MMKKGRFIEGMASTANLFVVGLDPDVEEIIAKNDTEALLDDWRALGHDFTGSVGLVQHELDTTPH